MKITPYDTRFNFLICYTATVVRFMKFLLSLSLCLPNPMCSYGQEIQAVSAAKLQEVVAPYYAALSNHDWKAMNAFIYEIEPGGNALGLFFLEAFADTPKGAPWQMMFCYTLQLREEQIAKGIVQANLIVGVCPYKSQTTNTINGVTSDLWLKVGEEWRVIPSPPEEGSMELKKLPHPAFMSSSRFSSVETVNSYIEALEASRKRYNKLSEEHAQALTKLYSQPDTAERQAALDKLKRDMRESWAKEGEINRELRRKSRITGQK
jgi:hypothetical protein